MSNDDSNPMHRIGHGRGDDYSPRKTSAYSFVQPAEKKVEPTQPMGAVPATLTVRDVIERLIGVNSVAWTMLPKSIQDGLIDRTQEFQLIGGYAGQADLTPDILYNGVVIHFNGAIWVVDKIVR